MEQKQQKCLTRQQQDLIDALDELDLIPFPEDEDPPYWMDTYTMDPGFVPASPDFFDFSSFDKTETYVLRSPRFFFIISIRKKKTERRLEKLLKGDLIRSRAYNVIVLGAKSQVALTEAEWMVNGDPWKIGGSPYADVYFWKERVAYMSHSNEWFDEDQRVETPGEPQTYRRGFPTRHFDTREEADAFVQFAKEEIFRTIDSDWNKDREFCAMTDKLKQLHTNSSS